METYDKRTASQSTTGEEFDLASSIPSEQSRSWSRLINRSKRIATIGALLVGANILAPPAHADEPTCYGDYCSGQYPDAAHCDEDARTLTELIVTDRGIHFGANISATPGITIENGGTETEVAKLEVRWSDKCGTSWARLNTRQDTNINSVGIEQDGGYTQSRDIGRFLEGSPSALSFTPMIYGRDHSYQAFVMRNGGLGDLTDDRVSTYWTSQDLR